MSAGWQIKVAIQLDPPSGLQGTLKSLVIPRSPVIPRLRREQHPHRGVPGERSVERTQRLERLVTASGSFRFNFCRLNIKIRSFSLGSLGAGKDVVVRCLTL
jgi:hypothetical protein